MTMRIPECEIAWLAGLFEGEGNFNVRPNQIVLRIYLTDLDVLHKAQSITGMGTIVSKKLYKPSKKAQWLWAGYRRKDVLYLTQAMLPWLGERRAETAREVVRRLSDVK